MPDAGTPPPFRSIAVVSGKGGSGKTMLTAVLARILDSVGHPAIIMDADTGTAGMTYYLGLKLIPNAAVGFADLVSREHGFVGPPLGSTTSYNPPGIDGPPGSFTPGGIQIPPLQTVAGYNKTTFFGIGDHRRLFSMSPGIDLSSTLASVVRTLRDAGAYLVVDCRGGIDQDSIAVCREVDDIILVVESDTTSFQATQHLVDILSANDVGHKLSGFMINKVFDDPTVIARNGTAVFRSRFLSAIPFDLRATRAFLVGDVPSVDSLFGAHVWAGLHKLYRTVPEPRRRTWSFGEFREVGLSNLDSLRGGILMGGLILASVSAMALKLVERGILWDEPFLALGGSSYWLTMTGVVALLGLFGSLEPTRRAIGRVFAGYVSILGRLLSSRESDQ